MATAASRRLGGAIAVSLSEGAILGEFLRTKVSVVGKEEGPEVSGGGVSSATPVLLTHGSNDEVEPCERVRREVCFAGFVYPFFLIFDATHTSPALPGGVRALVVGWMMLTGPFHCRMAVVTYPLIVVVCVWM